MNWLKTDIITSTQGIEPVCGMLLNLGITGTEICDKEDFKDFLEHNRKYWDYVDEELERLKTSDTKITVYLSLDEEGKNKLEEIKAALAQLKKSEGAKAFGSLSLLTAEVKDEDWSENWKKYFKPISVGEKVLIVPEWEETPQTDRTVFKVNPGMSFGTGSHESTQMCIEEIEKYVTADTEILDLGCGSGILSIIGLLLGAKDAVAVDIDPAAVEVAFDNLKLNGIDQSRLKGYAGDITADKKLCEALSEKKYDLVIANIVADVIIALSPFVKNFMKNDGYFVCSGIINERCEEVVSALKAAGLNILNVRGKGEWSAILCNL